MPPRRYVIEFVVSVPWKHAGGGGFKPSPALRRCRATLRTEKRYVSRSASGVSETPCHMRRQADAKDCISHLVTRAPLPARA
eukprot:COSAG01_NODE_7274_length_3274_cov_2.216063_4_plen_82_part_00